MMGRLVDAALVERTVDPRDDYRAELQAKAVSALAARDQIGDRAFEEFREPTPEE